MANLPVHRSAWIKQQQQRQEQSSLVASQSILVEGELDSELDVDPELWCSCQGYNDSCLTNCCDRKGEDSCVWYHYDCLGLTIKEGQRIEASGEDFVCLIQNNSMDPSFIVDTPACLIHLLILLGEKFHTHGAGPSSDLSLAALLLLRLILLFWLHL